MTPTTPTQNLVDCSIRLPSAPDAATRQAQERRGMALGLLGVFIFALTLPMTRLAVGGPDAPQLSGLFVALGRAAVAGVLSALWLVATRAPAPRRGDWLPLALTAAGVVFGFPLLTSIAMRHVQAVHASVIVGLLPLATAAMGALLQRERPSKGFWWCAMAGAALVATFAVLRSGSAGLSLHPADLLLLGAVLLAAVGYGFGGRLAQRMRGEHVICWALVLASPVTLPAAWWTQPHAEASIASWWAFGYVSLFSMWLGFFAWYRGLALGGVVRVSQMQLVQPFLSMLFAAPLLRESLDAVTVGFGLAVIATVFIGRKMPVRRLAAS